MTITKARLLTRRILAAWRRSRSRTPPRGSARLRARVRVEVDVLQALGREVRVELGRGDVRVAEHLLQRAQVAAAREQVRRKRVAQRVRAHGVGKARARGVALDDLVEALARETAAAVIDEQARLPPGAAQLGPARGE